MKRRGNFSKAVEELIGIKQNDGEDGEAQEAVAVEEASPQTGYAEGPRDFDGRFGLSGGAVPTVYKSEASTPVAVITEDMVIKGTVNSQANILVEGTILGDVLSEGDCIVRGKIEGNVNLRSLLVEAGSIGGDISAGSAVIIEEKSSIHGNIKAERIEVNGSVTGNLDSETKIVLKSQAVVDGNIKAKELAIQEGAELKGSVNVHKA